MFILNNILLGVGLAMDAFSVSMANGLHDPKMKKSQMGKIAGVFAGSSDGSASIRSLNILRHLKEQSLGLPSCCSP